MWNTIHSSKVVEMAAIWKEELKDVERRIAEIEAELAKHWKVVDPLLEELTELKRKSAALRELLRAHGVELFK